MFSYICVFSYDRNKDTVRKALQGIYRMCSLIHTYICSLIYICVFSYESKNDTLDQALNNNKAHMPGAYTS